MHKIDPNNEDNEGKGGYNEEQKIQALTLKFRYQSLGAKLKDSKR